MRLTCHGALFLAGVRGPFETEIAAVRCELLLVCGSTDVVAGSVEPLADALPRSRVHVVDGLDHLDTPRSTDLAARAVELLTRP